jgi:hypothetical protein
MNDELYNWKEIVVLKNVSSVTDQTLVGSHCAQLGCGTSCGLLLESQSERLTPRNY